MGPLYLFGYKSHHQSTILSHLPPFTNGDTEFSASDLRRKTDDLPIGSAALGALTERGQVSKLTSRADVEFRVRTFVLGEPRGTKSA